LNSSTQVVSVNSDSDVIQCDASLFILPLEIIQFTPSFAFKETEYSPIIILSGQENCFIDSLLLHFFMKKYGFSFSAGNHSFDSPCEKGFIFPNPSYPHLLDGLDNLPHLYLPIRKPI
jgi:hypothetical protein